MGELDSKRPEQRKECFLLGFREEVSPVLRAPGMIWGYPCLVRVTLSDSFLQGVAICLTPKGGSDILVVTAIFHR